MKAWVCRKSGIPTSNSAFTLEDNYPAPVPKAKQILIKVKAVGLNPGGANAMFRPPFVWLQKRPAVPELKFSGDIAGGDLSSTTFSIGDEVFGITPFPASLFSGDGALAEFTISDATRILSKPATLSHVEAAALPIATILPYWSLVNTGGLNMGGNQRVFINGGSGATGTGAIQIAKAFGAHITSTCSPTSEALILSLGATETIDYRSVPISLSSHLASHYSSPSTAFDIIIDCVGLDELYRACPAFLKPGGLYASIGAPAGGVGEALMFGVRLARNGLLPGWLGGTPRKFMFVQVPQGEWKETFQKAMELVVEGKVKPVIDAEFGLGDALKGYERVLSGRAKGKVVITVG